MNFVYFPLHYQPERTTCPEGGRFNDQILVAGLLAHSLPEGWTLLIKEHPSQFLWQTEGELGRTRSYYQLFLELPRTMLVPLEVSSHMLMAHSRVVATVTGMAGWEACVRGRPVIVFGEPWYADCEGVFKVSNLDETKRAMAEIVAGQCPHQESTNAFAAAVERVGRRCYMNPSHAPLYPGLSEQENCAELVELFTEGESFAGARNRSEA